MKCTSAIVFLLNFFLVQSQLLWNFSPSSKEVFHAYVNEKTHSIQVFPSIQVNPIADSKLCSIVLLPTERNNVPDFIAGNVLDQDKGYGYLTFNGSLYHEAEAAGNLEAKTGFYHLRILAKDCSNPPKSTISWPITFEHIRSDVPIWSKRRYHFNIDSLHRPGDKIGKVTAYSSSLSTLDNLNNTYNSPIGDNTGMCAYTIQDSTYSFAINGHGVIRSLKRFNNHTDSVYEFNVTAFDCHLPAPYNSSVPVTIHVKASCTSQWNGIPKEIAYTALSNPRLIAANAKFAICPQSDTNDNPGMNPYGEDNDDDDNGDDEDEGDGDDLDDIDNVTSEYDYCPIEQVTLRMKILWSKEDIIVGDESNSPTPSSSVSSSSASAATASSSPSSTSASSSSASSQCDLDYYSLLANRKTCINPAQDTIIDLLPDISKLRQHHEYQPNPPHLNNIDSMNLPIVEKIKSLEAFPKISENDYPSGIYYFNGSTHLDLNHFGIFHTLQRFDNNKFTINFWMKHSPILLNQQYDEGFASSNGRENILCSSDEYEKNRHHFAVFLHNCKLVVLIRREPSNASISDSTQLLPSQWRFDVDEVCDSNWHHYSLTYNPPKYSLQKSIPSMGLDSEIELQLYVDGQLVPNNPELVQIAENMPMIHLSSRNHEHVRTTVGACWHGRSSQFSQHFLGYLAGLTFTNGYIQTSEELRCLPNCEPRLFINDPTFATKTDRFDTTSVRNSHLNSIIIQAKSLNELTSLLRKVTYYNPRLQYKPRYRPEPVAIQLNTMFTYSTDCEMPSTLNQVILISPLPPTKHTLSVLDAYSKNAYTDRHHDNSHSKSYQQQQQHPQQRYNNEQAHQRRFRNSLTTSNETQQSSPTPHRPHRNEMSSLSGISLILSNTRRSEILNQTFTSRKIDSDKLSSGVTIFPDLMLSWKVSSEMMKSFNISSVFQQTISTCSINLCNNNNNNHLSNFDGRLLLNSELLYLKPEYAINRLITYQRLNGLTIYGSSDISSYMNALKHVQWIYKDKHIIPLNKRCFNLSCEAAIQILKTDINLMRIKSNSIQSEFIIVHEKNGKIESLHSSTASSSFVEPSAQQHSVRLALPKAPRLLAKRHTNEFRSDLHLSSPVSPTWNKSIFLIIGASVLAVLLLLFVAVNRIQRIHSKSNYQFKSQTNNLHMIPCTEDILKQMYTSQQFNDADETIKPEKITSAEKLRNSKMNSDNSPIVITQQRQPKQAQNDPLRVIPNPIVNESDMKEFESKTVLLDEKRYNASLNMASSIYNHHNQSNNDPNDYERSDSPIICRPPTFEFYENPLRSDQEDEGDCECSCCEDDDDNDDAAK